MFIHRKINSPFQTDDGSSETTSTTKAGNAAKETVNINITDKECIQTYIKIKKIESLN